MNRNAILVIDDDADMRDLVRLVVQAMDVDVVEAATCAEGIAVFQANRDRVRLVLLDYFMPGMDPMACARALCRLAGPLGDARGRPLGDARGRPPMIVLCTAAADPAARAAEAGLSRWLAKPFELESLESLVREAVRERDALPTPGHG
jgi:CheY-like chemotaxis protein